MISVTEEMNCDVDFNCKIILLCNNRRFIVLLSRCSLSNFVEEKYLKRLDDALKSKDLLRVNATIEEIFDFVATLCQLIFRKSASIVRNESQVLDFDFYLNSEIYKLQVMIVDEKSKVIK